MKIQQQHIRFPENLKVKALLVENRIEIGEIAAEISKSRIWVSAVLNGHKEGKELISMIMEKLKHKENLIQHT